MKSDGHSKGLSLMLKAAFLLAIATTMLWPMRSSAQDEAVQGTVVDPSGAGIARARIQFSLNDRVVVTAFTDAAGAFRVDLAKLKGAAPAPADSSKLAVSAFGFSTTISPLRLDGPSRLVTITLQIASLKGSVSVTSQDPGDAESISPPNLKCLPCVEPSHSAAFSGGCSLNLAPLPRIVKTVSIRISWRLRRLGIPCST